LVNSNFKDVSFWILFLIPVIGIIFNSPLAGILAQNEIRKNCDILGTHQLVFDDQIFKVNSALYDLNITWDFIRKGYFKSGLLILVLFNKMVLIIPDKEITKEMAELFNDKLNLLIPVDYDPLFGQKRGGN
jgi:hypothetical protein